MSIILVIVALLQPPYTLDPSGVSFEAPTAGRYCLTVYQADWTGDHREACANVSAGPVRIDLPIAPGEHAFLSRLTPFVEWGPFDLPPEPPPVQYAAFLPLVARTPNR